MLPSGELNFKTNGSAPSLISSPCGCSGSAPWRLEYYSAYSAQYINHPTAGTVSVGFVEGENYELPGVGDRPSRCGYQNGDVNTTFLCIAWTPNTQATNWGHQYFTDLGPIIWPATGYFLANGQKASVGCANNTTIQADDGYLYVFYKDQSYYDIGQQMGAGRLPGIKVARAPVNDALNPHAYETFYEDSSGIHWNQSLPAGLNTATFKTIMEPPAHRVLRFLKVTATIRGLLWLRSLERTITWDWETTPTRIPIHRWRDSDSTWYSPQITTLKYSYDLVHWLGDREIYKAQNYKLSQFNYPIFSKCQWLDEYFYRRKQFLYYWHQSRVKRGKK